MIAFSSLNALEPTEDDILRKADKNPNTTGAELLGLSTANAGIREQSEVLQAAAAGNLSALIIVAHDPAGLPDVYGAGWNAALDKVPFLIFIGSNANETSAKADLVLPLAAFAEREGTVTNFAGRIQLQRRAFDPLGESLPGWDLLSRLGNALGGDYNYNSASEVFDELASGEARFAGLNYEIIGDNGEKING
jgi:predicted molibdopterin-dependent oxidoreductase YjgC